MRLTDDQIKMARITYTKVVQDDFILDLIDTIEALQQEINRLEVQVEADKDLIRELNNSYINSELNLSALISDKDEQAGRLMKMDYLLRRTLPILEVANDQQELIEQINELLGGKEDV